MRADKKPPRAADVHLGKSMSLRQRAFGTNPFFSRPEFQIRRAEDQQQENQSRN